MSGQVWPQGASLVWGDVFIHRLDVGALRWMAFVFMAQQFLNFSTITYGLMKHSYICTTAALQTCTMITLITEVSYFTQFCCCGMVCPGKIKLTYILIKVKLVF